MFNLIFKTFRDKRFFILGWVLGLALLSYTITILYPTFNSTMLDEMAESIPAAMQGFIGELANLKQLDGYIGSQVFEINLPIFIFVFAVLIAVGLTVTEEDKGQLRTLIALPISRRKILLAKWASIASLSLLVSLATIVGVYLGLWQINESMNTADMLNLTLILWLLTTTIATLIFAVGLATGSRALTITTGVVIAAGSYLLTTFAQGVEWLQDYEWLSILYYFPAPEIAAGTVEANNIFVYLGLLLAALIATLIFFPRRDIKS